MCGESISTSVQCLARERNKKEESCLNDSVTVVSVLKWNGVMTSSKPVFIFAMKCSLTFLEHVGVVSLIF